ncbi:MAG: ATP-binding protein [Bacteroidia bacterium]
MNFLKAKPSSLFWFYLLVIYILLQFIWWTYLMVESNNEIYHYKTELNVFKGESLQEVFNNGKELSQKQYVQLLMITGEGGVFIILLLLGIYQIRNSFKKETALAQQQKNFLLSVTHELKSPIASAKLQLQTLQKRELERDKQKEIIGNALNDTERLNNLVENILLAAKIENNIYSLYKEEVNLSAFITELITQNLSSFNYKQKVVLTIEPNTFMEIDKIGFHSIVLNLFENAVKYSPADSTITVSLKKEESKILLKIIDEGIGIENKYTPFIFNKFYRIGNEETRNTKGTGLGLYITNYLVKQHHGNIAVTSNLPKGTIFETIFNTNKS